MRKIIFIALFTAFGITHADTVYKSVGPDGKIIYSQDPPAGGKAAKKLSFTNLPSTPMPDSVLRYRDELEKSMKKRLADGAKREFVFPTIFTAQWCGYCRQAKAYLAEKKIRYQEYDIDTADGMRAYVESGSGRGVPVLLWKGQKVHGFSKAAYDALVGSSR